MVVSDNGTGRTSKAVLKWAQDHRIEWCHIAPGEPEQNGYVEGFNGRMHNELLNEAVFAGLPQARTAIAAWLTDCNTPRPHSAHGYRTPAVHAAKFTATGPGSPPVPGIRTWPHCPYRAERRNLGHGSSFCRMKVPRPVTVADAASCCIMVSDIDGRHLRRHAGRKFLRSRHLGTLRDGLTGNQQEWFCIKGKATA